MTMAEIDRRREALGEARAVERNPSRWPRIHADHARVEVHTYVVLAERYVEAALREWWAQGCREVVDVNATGGHLPGCPGLTGGACDCGGPVCPECWNWGMSERLDDCTTCGGTGHLP